MDCVVDDLIDDGVGGFLELVVLGMVYVLW